MLKFSRFIWYTYSVYSKQIQSNFNEFKDICVQTFNNSTIESSLNTSFKPCKRSQSDLQTKKHTVGSWIFNFLSFHSNFYFTFFLNNTVVLKKIICYYGCTGTFHFSPLFKKHDVNKTLIIICLVSGIYRLVRKLEGKTIICID